MNKITHYGGIAITIAVLAMTGACATSSNGNASTQAALSTLAQAFGYVGSATCEKCHRSYYDSWKNTLHNKEIRTIPEAGGVVADSDGDGVDDFKTGVDLGVPANTLLGVNDTSWLDYKLAGTSPQLNYDAIAGVYQVIIGSAVYNVDYVLGGAGWKQRYLTILGGNTFILPIQYNVDTNEWVTYHPEDWYVDPTNNDYSIITTPISYDRSWEKRCVGCHVTGLVSVTQTPNAGPWVISYSERNIACEACHGPGLNHVSLGGGIGTNRNPRTMAADLANEVCGRCHTRGASIGGAHEYPWIDAENRGPVPGQDRLDDFFVETTSSNDLWPNGQSKEHQQQFLDFKQSGMWAVGIRCFDCHDPHGSGLEHDIRMDVDNNSLCLSCHGLGGIFEMAWATDGDVSDHTNHFVNETMPSEPDTGNGSRCAKCHMPKVVTSANAYDLHSHTFLPIEPRNDMPSSCMSRNYGSCHSAVAPGSTKTTYGEPLFDNTNPGDTARATSAFYSWWPVYNTPTVTAVPVGSDPDLTNPNDLDDAAWALAPKTILNSGVIMQAMYTAGGKLSVRAIWNDATMSMTRGGSWAWNGASWSTAQSSGQGEDRLAILWNKNINHFAQRGCGMMCHSDVHASTDLPAGTDGTEDEAYLDVVGESGDMWHMKAARALGAWNASTGTSINTDLAITVNTTYEVTAGEVFISGYADDKWIGNWDANNPPDGGRFGDAKTTGLYSRNRNAAKNAPLYMESNPISYIDAMVLTQWEINNGETIDADPTSGGYAGDAAVDIAWANYLAVGAVVPERYLTTPGGSRGDVRQAGKWKDGVWSLVYQRDLVTNNSDDLNFIDLTADYLFGVALMDNTGGGSHTVADKVVKLVFLP